VWRDVESRPRRHALRTTQRRLLATVATLGLACAGFVGLAPAAHATVVSGCNAFSGATALGATYHDGDVVVAACGPRPAFGGTTRPIYAYPGALSNPGYQCAEFVARYLYVKFGLTMGISTNGDQEVDHYVAKYPKQFTSIRNGMLDQAPTQGDVISFSASSNFHSASGGHTGVVQSSSVDVNGNGSITVIEENWSATGARVIPVSNWSVQLNGFPYIKWMHPLGFNSSVLQATPVETDAPNGLFTNVPIRHFIAVTNLKSSALTVQALVFGIRDPQGNVSTEVCATNLVLAAGELDNCAGSSSWTLPGTYEVWPEWQDAAGNWYSGQLGGITTFTLTAGGAPAAPPSVSAVVASNAVQVSWAAPFNTNGPPLSGYLVTTTPATAKTTVPPDAVSMSLNGLKPNVTYTIAVRALNAIGASPPTTTVLDGSVLTLQPRPAPVDYNGVVTLQGSLLSAEGAARVAAPLDVWSSTDGVQWTDIAQLQTDANGAFSYNVTPLVTTSYRVTWTGTDQFRPITSRVSAVVVRPRVTLSLQHSSAHLRHSVNYSGTYVPNAGGVTLQVQRLVRGTWGTIATVTTSAAGSFSGRWTPKQVGNYSLRVLSPASATLGVGSSPVRTVRIVR